MDNALVVLSGGQDSTTCLYWAKQQAARVRALTIDYGQRHRIEVEAARNIAKLAEVEHEVLSVGAILNGTSPLVSGEAVESYESAEVLPGGIEKTFVPMRNALFLVLAANRAVVHGCDALITGVSMEDYGGYPDCRDTFIEAMQLAINRAIGESATAPTITTPLMHLDKEATVKLAASLPGCLEALALSHTCYNGLFPPCGSCHACLLRQRGFERAGIRDPLLERAASAAETV